MGSEIQRRYPICTPFPDDRSDSLDIADDATLIYGKKIIILIFINISFIQSHGAVLINLCGKKSCHIAPYYIDISH
ncbi:hypothetical protein EVK84_06145 [Edwardsiella piscicida]|nr:hypothetical protein EVK84_06145 [Edwardsiella piscicida]QHR95914.1 hypothetical protein GT752_12150 [Edwardsiella piscicida]